MSRVTLVRPFSGIQRSTPWQLRFLLSPVLFATICRAQQNNSNLTTVTSCTNDTDLTATFSSSTRVRAWVSQPDYRGSFDILWTSLVTIFISTYGMLCLNVP